jgi:hypothetical protein
MPRPTVLYCNKVKHHCTANKTNHLSTDVALIQTRHTRQTLHTRSTRHTTPTVPVIQAHQSHHAQHAHQEHHAHQAHQAHQARKATVLCTDQATKTAMYCTVLYCTVLYCTVLYCDVLYSHDSKFDVCNLCFEKTGWEPTIKCLCACNATTMV